jgi:hypothetical protein
MAGTYGTPYGVPMVGTAFGYEVEVWEAPVKGALADHHGGDAFLRRCLLRQLRTE